MCCGCSGMGWISGVPALAIPCRKRWTAMPARSEQRPLLGICLGAQMLAMHLGARVAPHPQGRVQVGYYPIRPTAAGVAVCPHWPDHVYHWHREGFERPAGAEMLAEGTDSTVPALRFDHAFGLQFHPDVSYAMMHCWVTRDERDLESPGALPRHRHFADRAVQDTTERAWLRQFLDGWLAGARADVGDVGSGRITHQAIA